MVSQLQEFLGHGHFSFKDDPSEIIEAEFSLKFFSDSRVLIYIQIPWPKSMLKIVDPHQSYMTRFGMKGNLNLRDATVEVDELKIHGSSIKNGKSTIDLILESLSPVTIRFGDQSNEYTVHYGVTNCIFTGCRYLGNFAFSQEFEVRIDSKTIGFKGVSDYNRLFDDLRKNNSIEVTAEVISRGSAQTEKADNILAGDLVKLVSLATGIENSIIYRDYLEENRLFKTVFIPWHTEEFSGEMEIIHITDPISCNLKHFLEVGHPRYLEYRDSLGLDVFFFYKKRSEQMHITDLKFILGIIALESICGHFEGFMEHSGHPIPKRSVQDCQTKIQSLSKRKGYEIPDLVISDIAQSVAFNHPYFSDKLRTLLDEFSVKYDKSDLNLIKIRDNIVHYGKFPEGIDEFKECHRLTDLLSRIILKILNYDRNYISRLEGFKIITLD